MLKPFFVNMAPSSKLTLSVILTLLLLGGSIYLTLQVREASKERQAVTADLTEINNIKYGLLSVYEWKRKVSSILSKRIDEFEITTENRGTIRRYITQAMHRLIDEVDVFLKQEKKRGNFFERTLKSAAYSVAFDAEKFREQIPQWTREVMKELDNDKTREELKVYIKARMEELLTSTVAVEDRRGIERVQEARDCPELADCRKELGRQTNELATRIQHLSWMIIGLSFLAFLIWLFTKAKKRTAFQYFLLCGVTLVLLIGGVSNPMIDIDARIDELYFQLMGEQVIFNNQVLFYQSKSLTDVVEILIRNGDLQAIFVGGLIFLFSIIFPLLKLIASGVAIQKPALVRKKGLLRFLALKSGKWSMADVMVVAIFMAYIGFRGVIGSQLGQLENPNNAVEIITTNKGTALQVGFYLFTCFCLASLVLSTITEKQLKEEK